MRRGEAKSEHGCAREKGLGGLACIFFKVRDIFVIFPIKF